MHGKKAKFFALAALAISTALWAAPAPAAARLALVLGNDDYAGRFRLSCCVNDAKEMARWLKSVGYEPTEVTLLTNARRADTVAALDKLAEAAKTQHPEQVFIYYSGHGLAVKDDDGDEGDLDGKDEALVAIDDPRQVDDIEKILIRDDLFYGYVNRIAETTGQVFIVMDCCYSGGLTKSVPKNLDLSKAARQPAKFIHIDELKDLMSGGEKTKGLFKVPPARAKGFAEKRVPAEIKRIQARRGVVFLSASNQFQLSRAGDPLSAFTSAFLHTVEKDRERLTAVHKKFTLKVLRDELADKLFEVPQSPVLECQPADQALEKEPFIPGFFRTPVHWEEEKAATSIVSQLLALPPERKAKFWKLQVTPTRRPPLRVGEQFALQVKTNQKGHLVMFTVGASGQVTFLYPNRHRIINKVDAGQQTVLPWGDGLKVQPPVGQETFYVYLLDRNPFENFDFGKTAGAMAAGDLEGILRQNPALRNRVSRVTSEDLNAPRARGMIVERVGEALRAEGADVRLFDDGAPRWTRAVVQLTTVE